MNISENEIVFPEKPYVNRAGDFEIAQAKNKSNNKYLYTLWSHFPYDWNKKSSVEYRFLANNKPKSEAEKLFKGIEIEELPYTEGFFFPRFSDDEQAIKFLQSELFDLTYEVRENE